jgi:hypothetical protein
MTYSDKFSMNSYTNHVRFNVFLCDLDRSNTYAKSNGGVYAVDASGNQKWLMDLIYIEEGSDENPFGKVRARYCIGEARAWFANGYGQAEQQISFNNEDYLVQKWGSDNHYLTAKIDFYYPASMAGKTWKFYYTYKHTNGNTYTMTLGSANLSSTMGYSHFNMGDYSVERTSPDKIKFTVPALPDDVDSKREEIHIHEGSYKVSFTYTKQDGETVVTTETLACEKSNKKTYTIDIPEEVGNPKRIDMDLEATEALKDAQDYYWKNEKKFLQSSIFLTAPIPNSLRVEYRQFDKSADLSWNAYPSDGSKYLESVPYIYRVETDKNGKPLNGSWSKRGTVDGAGSKQTLGYSDNGVSASTYYKYMVLNVPKAWIDNGINSSSLNNPSDDLLKRLGYVESDVFDTKPTMTIYNLQQDTTVTDKVKITWQYSRIPSSASTINFNVLRKTNEEGNWSDFGTVSGDTDPAADYKLSFVDTDLPNVSTRYQYMVRLKLSDKDVFESSSVYGGLLSGSKVTKFEATKGTHEGTVRLSWNSKQVGTESTTYVISRRYLNSSDDYMRINSTSGTAEQYTFEDNTVKPGYYYDYKIEAFNGSVLQNTLHDAGFCQARGVISGRITFGTGSSVEDVRLSLRAADSGDDNAVKGSSQRVDGASTGIAWNVSEKETAKIFGEDKDFTVQLFVRPDEGMAEGAVMGNIPGIGQLLIGAQTANGYELKVKNQDGESATGLQLEENVFSLLTVSRDGNNIQIQVNNDTPTTLAAPTAAMDVFSVGGAAAVTSAQGFEGNITEVRVWNHLLSEKEQKTYFDRILNGREKGLALYWPMDEGLDHYVFDASYANDLPNGRHATVGNNISASSMIPVEEQLSRYAMTNESGEFIIRGIPFVGSGSSYTIIPTRGIHDFSPVTRNGFIGNGSLTLNNYDFTDVSSFPVRGKVTYLNTNIPADSIQFKIDGNPVQNKDQLVMTDANGEYEISVPIGKHLIEAYKDGHRLTSFPLDGTTHDFKKSEVVNFVDSTLVNVTGRINGGFSDQDELLGFDRSVNRLGKATIKLSLGKESQCSFNYIVDDHGDGSFGTEPIPVASASSNIQSTAYRAGGSHDDTYYIYITTDAKNGEFSALLPPLKYKVESITFDGGTDYDDEPVFAQNLPTLDATGTSDDRILCDSMQVDNQWEKYQYSAKMIRQYRAEPSITVVQQGMKNGAFGAVKVPVQTLQQTIDSLEVVTYTDKGYSYRFGHPIFRQNQRYTFDLNVSENYKNLDSGETFMEIPRDATLSVINDASMLTSVTAEKVIVNGKEIAPGTDVDTPNILIVPDSAGHVLYEFEGGWPYFGNGYLRNMSVGVQVGGRTTMWKAPDSEGDALDLILLGCLPTGSNFITDGVDKVDYVIRRPAGSTSVASLEETKLNSNTKTSLMVDESNWGGGMYMSLAPTFNIHQGVSIFGSIVMTDSKWQAVANHTVTRTNTYKDTDYSSDKDTYTFTKKVTTPSSIPFSILNGDYRPESGDTYIGHSTNYIFSKANMLNIFEQSDGTYKIEQKDGVGVSESFKTQFTFTQEYIEDYLIPNWQTFIKDRLIHVEGNHWDANNPQVVRVPGEVRYYTSYTSDDEEFGKANGDPSWGTLFKDRNGWPSYRMVDGTGEGTIDEVEHAINQITAWKGTLAANEEDKLKAFDDNKLEGNFSISGGNTLTQTSKTEHMSSTGFKTVDTYTVNNESKFGTLFNNAGAYGILQFHNTKGTGYEEDDTDGYSTTVSWTLSDADARTALSVDVYKSPMGWGPIFRTRGGQTANPYEGGTETTYYNKGTKLNEATMRVERPELRVVGASEQTGVPTGGEAKFTLQLYNGSETDSYCYYILMVNENTNPDGAWLYIDGAPLSQGYDGRRFKMAPGETIEKTLVITQSDRSITKYRNIQVVLRSVNDISTISDPVTLNVEFVPASAHVDLAVDHTIINKDLKDEEGGITATIKNLDRQDEGLQGIRLRYRRKGIDTWSLIKQWSDLPELKSQGYEPMPEGSTFKEKVTFLDDGLYELQAQTFGLYGTKEVTYESTIVEVTQDTHGPKVLGMIYPENGLLTYQNRNGMNVRFNETLNDNALSKSDNFRIEGGMNNVIPEGQAPDVAAQLNGSSIMTDALYDLTNTDYAFSLWFYRQGDGNIISLGTENNLLALSTHDDGKLRARVGTADDIFDSDVQLPKDQWMFMALNYKRKTVDDPENRLTLLYVTADDAQPNYVVRNIAAKDLDGHGALSIGGNGMQGMMSDLTIWNSSVTAHELYENRKQVKAAFTPGLVGYWRMDEGHGTQMSDRVRSRHMHMQSESWHINNENRAANLTGEEALKIDISTFNPTKTDNYAYEMWFRGTETDNVGVATLLSAGENVAVKLEQGRLQLKAYENSVLLSDKSYLDGNWHHFALNVHRGISAIVYLDGQPVKVLAETAVPGISGHYLLVGDAFKGDVDEIRIWNAALDGKVISDRMYERMDNSYPGLVGYFPMEEIHRTIQGNVVTDFSTANFGEKDSRLSIANAQQALTQSVNAPALKPGSTRMRMEDTQFDFTASGEYIFFSFPDTSLPLMDNNDFTASVSYIKDDHGNNSETVTWMFHADFASVIWGEKSQSGLNESPQITGEYSKSWDKTLNIAMSVVNRTNQTQSYEISGLPDWITVDKPIGTVEGESTQVVFTIAPTVPVGRYSQDIYLTDRLGIKRVFRINLTVRGDVPNWTVNPNLYESNMMLTGQVYVEDKISEFTGSKVAAFDDLGMCRGVASPEYVSTRDAYYVNMVLYGAAGTDISTGERDLTFKMYDASTGRTYPIVLVTLPGKVPSDTVRYVPDAIYGSYDNPVIFSATNMLQQAISLPTGWSWMSLYVNPISTAISDVLPKGKADRKKFQNIKSHNAIASVRYEDGAVLGSLKEMTPGNMYKVQVTSNVNYDLMGSFIDVKNTEATMYPDWNWIGSLSNAVMSVQDAFADLSPEPGDVVKTRTAFSSVNANGQWEGTLKSIVPGVGYIYLSKATQPKTFHYPQATSGNGNARYMAAARALADMETTGTNHYQPVDPHSYPDNMNIIATIVYNGSPVESAELGAFVNGVCRGATTCDNGYYFLTILGSSADDMDNKVEIRAFVNGEEHVTVSLPFMSDAIYGTLENPYVINLDATAIRTVGADSADDDEDWYTLQGIKIGRKPTATGVYIHKGKTVRVTQRKR